jgi:hypothetical protein
LGGPNRFDLSGNVADGLAAQKALVSHDHPGYHICGKCNGDEFLGSWQFLLLIGITGFDSG